MPLAVWQSCDVGNDLETEGPVNLDEVLVWSCGHKQLQNSSVDSHGTLVEQSVPLLYNRNRNHS